MTVLWTAEDIEDACGARGLEPMVRAYMKNGLPEAEARKRATQDIQTFRLDPATGEFLFTDEEARALAAPVLALMKEPST